MATMRAIVQERYGSPLEVLKLSEVERPVPASGEVLVRNVASSANPYDWHYVRGEPWLMRLTESGLRAPKKPIPGGDVCGVVEAVGPGVAQTAVGDEVYAFHHGAFAEYICVPEERVAAKPANLSFDKAATMPLVGVTALQGLRDVGEIAAGDDVLIVGASGGVGTVAVQMAKAWGATVTGVCSEANVELVGSLGADAVIDYTRDDFTTGTARYDLVFQLAGTYSPRDIRRVMAADGRLVQAMGDGGKLAGPAARIASAAALNPFVSQTMKILLADETAAALDDVRELVESGAVRPVIDSTLPLAEVGAAIELVESGSPKGKVAISIAGN